MSQETEQAGRDVTRVARVALPDGTPVWARITGTGELRAPSAPPGQLSYSDTGFTERVEAGVESLHSLVTGVARSLAQPLRAVRPDEVSVEFGIELTAKAGKVVGLLADGEAKAAITVTLTWSHGGPPDLTDPGTTPDGPSGRAAQDGGPQGGSPRGGSPQGGFRGRGAGSGRAADSGNGTGFGRHGDAGQSAGSGEGTDAGAQPAPSSGDAFATSLHGEASAQGNRASARGRRSAHGRGDVPVRRGRGGRTGRALRLVPPAAAGLGVDGPPAQAAGYRVGRSVERGAGSGDGGGAGARGAAPGDDAGACGPVHVRGVVPDPASRARGAVPGRASALDGSPGSAPAARVGAEPAGDHTPSPSHGDHPTHGAAPATSELSPELDGPSGAFPRPTPRETPALPDPDAPPGASGHRGGGGQGGGGWR